MMGYRDGVLVCYTPLEGVLLYDGCDAMVKDLNIWDWQTTDRMASVTREHEVYISSNGPIQKHPMQCSNQSAELPMHAFLQPYSYIMRLVRNKTPKHFRTSLSVLCLLLFLSTALLRHSRAT